MGLILLYSARLRQMDQLPQLVTEVEDICRSMQWESHRVDVVMEAAADAVPLEPGDGDPKQVHL